MNVNKVDQSVIQYLFGNRQIRHSFYLEIDRDKDKLAGWSFSHAWDNSGNGEDRDAADTEDVFDEELKMQSPETSVLSISQNSSLAVGSGTDSVEGGLAEDLGEMVRLLRKNLEVRDRSWRLMTFRDCFVGNEAVAWMVGKGMVEKPSEAVQVGNMLLACGIIQHVSNAHVFKNRQLFYRFLNPSMYVFAFPAKLL